MRFSSRIVTAAASVAFVMLALTAQGQSTAPNSTRTVDHDADSSRYVPSVLTNHALAKIGIVTLLTTAAFTPFDAIITRKAQAIRGTGTGPVERVASTLNWIGDPGSVVIPTLLLGTGWISGNGTMREIGLHATESVVLTGGATALIKGLAGRRRPENGTQDMDDFSFAGGFRGGDGSQSFPSGHTTAAFALATTLTLETMRFNPDVTKLVAIASYSVATGVGMARVYTNHHWASDVALGAGVGTLGALIVERYAHGGLVRHRTVASVLPSSLNMAQDGRATVGWTIPFSR